MRQEYLRAAAEAYANITPIQSDCYHYLNDGFDTAIQARLHSRYEVLLSSNNIRAKYIHQVVSTALSECQYPINTATGAAWSDSERAAFASIPKQTWSDNKLSDYINFILKDINVNSRSAWAAIQMQVVGYEQGT